jgi:hypothetical protein
MLAPNHNNIRTFVLVCQGQQAPFAPLPVEIYFPVYSNTAVEMILDLVGEKMLSNQLLSGQEVGGAHVCPMMLVTSCKWP